MFNKIFEGYRKFLTEDEEALLIEGRKDVALSRATKGIDDETLKDIASSQMERLLDADPSGKQKYANWLAGQINKEVFRSIKYVKDQLRGDMMVADYIDSVRASVERTGRELARMLPTYHKLAERNLIDKNINKYDEYTDWSYETYQAQKQFEEREKLKGMEAEAKQTITTLIDDPDYTLKRPDSMAASCILGMGAQWCIAATKSQNYFDQYTREGKGFYILELRHLPLDDDFKKIALQYDSDKGGYSDNTEPSLIWHSPNETQDEEDVRKAIRDNIIMKGFWNSQENPKALKKYYNKGKRGDENRQELETILLNLGNQLDEYQMAYDDSDVVSKPEILENLKTYLKAADLDGEDLDELIESLDELVSEEYYNIIGSAHEHFSENPTGVSDEDYNRAIEEAELKHFDVYVERDFDGDGNDYISASAGFDFDVEDVVEDNVDTDDLENFLSKALNDEGVWNIELYSDGMNVSVNMHQNEYYDDDPLQRFTSFLDDVKEADNVYEEVFKAVVQEMKDSGMIASESLKSLVKRFSEREYNNFDVDFEDGNVAVSSRLLVRLQLPKELTSKSRYLSKELPRPKTSEDPRSFIWDFMIGQLRSTESINKIKQDLIKRLNVVFERALKSAASQLRLPLNEQEGVRVPEFKIDFGAMGPREQASIPPKQTSGSNTWDIRDKFTYWLDIVLKGNETPEEIAQIEKFLNIIDKEEFFEKIRQYVEALVNNQLQKEIIPAARKAAADTISREKSTDELSDLAERWRRFIK
tara:strand:- start:852 stop:3131 length:2280 start_codon:yes stop_codon:yes gene_type:complete